MSRTTYKALIFHVGPHSLLVDSLLIQQVVACNATFRENTGHAGDQHGSIVHWRNSTLPYVLFRRCLNLPDTLPGHAVILLDDAGQPAVMLGVDRIERIMDFNEKTIFPFQGIHAELDVFFDALLQASGREEMFLRLKPPDLWLNQVMQGITTSDALTTTENTHD